MDDEERIGDVPVLRHTEATDLEDLSDLDVLDAVSAHVETHVGPISSVYHEIISARVHLDVLVVAPGPDRPFTYLVTCGMSSAPMAGTPDEDRPDLERLELCLALPPNWPTGADAWKDERNFWPVRLLKTLAGLPHEYATWLWMGHTIPNGDPAEPYADDVAFDGAIVLPPSLPTEGFVQGLEIDGHPITFLAVVPLHPEEMAHKLSHDLDALADALERAGVDERIDTPRGPAVRVRRRFGRRR